MGRGSLWLWGVGVVGALPVQAQEPPAEVQSLREARGPVTAVDLRRSTLTLEEASGRVELRVDETTTFFLPGRTGRLEDLKPGQRVRATYERGEHGAVAQWIELIEP